MSSGLCRGSDWSRRDDRSENMHVTRGDRCRNERSQARASRWRASGEMFRVVETIDELGHKTRRRVQGQMATTDQDTILRILDCRASRFRPGFRLTEEGHQGDYAIDETGTLDMWELRQD